MTGPRGLPNRPGGLPRIPRKGRKENSKPGPLVNRKQAHPKGKTGAQRRNQKRGQKFPRTRQKQRARPRRHFFGKRRSEGRAGEGRGAAQGRPHFPAGTCLETRSWGQPPGTAGSNRPVPGPRIWIRKHKVGTPELRCLGNHQHHHHQHHHHRGIAVIITIAEHHLALAILGGI